MLCYKGAYIKMNSTASENVKTNKLRAIELTKMALITSLYVTVTIVLAVFSFGLIQFRVSEMFNYLALYHKRYVLAVTLGVIIANFMSPTWILDVPIGGILTFLVLILCRYLTKHVKNDLYKIMITAIVFSVSMFTVAGQLTFLLGMPFFSTWLIVGLGELVSMVIGGMFVYLLNKKIDLTR